MNEAERKYLTKALFITGVVLMSVVVGLDLWRQRRDDDYTQERRDRADRLQQENAAFRERTDRRLDEILEKLRQ